MPCQRLIPWVVAGLALAAGQDSFSRADRAIRGGDYAGALRELDSVRCAGPGAAPCEARIPSMKGAAYLFSGEYDKAENAFAEGLRLYRALSDTAHVVDLLNNLGTIHFYRGQYAEAYVRYQQAQLEMQGKTDQSWHPAAAHLTAANTATLFQRLGRYQEALGVYRSLGRQPAGLSDIERAQLLVNLAVLNRRLGDPYKARDLLRDARARLSPRQHLDAWLGVVKNLGILLALDFLDLDAAENEFKLALGAAARAGNSREEVQARLYLAEVRFRRGDLAGAEALWRSSLAGSLTHQTPEERWRSLYGIARVQRRQGKVSESEAALAEGMDVIEAMRGGAGASTMRTDFLADKLDVYEEALGLAAQRGDLAAAFAAMERARALLLRESLGGTFARPDIWRVQSRLKPDEAALLYRVGRTESHLLWLTRGKAGIRRLRLTESSAIRPLNDFRNDLDGAGEAKRALSADLLNGLKDLLTPSVRRLWIVPDGALALLPFEVLPLEEAVLLERFEIAYLPAAFLLRDAPPPGLRLRWPWNRQMVAYADPDVKQANLLPGDERWPPLPRSRGEVEAIAAVLPGASELYHGAGITSESWLDRAASAPVVHLATHGAGDPESAQRNRLLVGKGYLYGDQLPPRKLRAVHLSVLSACETEAGAMQRGEGVQSLGRQFLMAGARATVASLWKVDDAATALLMREFYRELAGGAEIATALRRAKLRLLRSSGPLRSPRFWAAFVVQGAAGEPLPRWISWRAMIFAGAVALALLAGALWLFGRPRASRWRPAK